VVQLVDMKPFVVRLAFYVLIIASLLRRRHR
jgi:hypothetical protein